MERPSALSLTPRTAAATESCRCRSPEWPRHFTDELDLVGALLLKWHARLSGNIERALMREPMDLEAAVATAWRTTAEQMPGVRLVVDRCTESPETAEMATAMERAREREWVRLALAAGLANDQSPAAVEAGRHVEALARAGTRARWRPTSPPRPRRDADTPTGDATSDDATRRASRSSTGSRRLSPPDP